MNAAADQQEPQAGQLGAELSPASITSSSKTSSFCSFDVKIWEELHLQSLLSSSGINEQHIETGAAGAQLWKAEKNKEPKAHSHSQVFSFFSSSARGASFSGFSSPHRLSSASSQSGHPMFLASSRRDGTLLTNSPLHCKAEQPPVVQVIQTGSMSFTPDELVLQSSSAMDNSLLMENFQAVESKTTPSEQEELLPLNDDANIEQSMVLGTRPNAKFLQISAPDVYSAPISPLKCAGAIPFKWEETPGRPKLHADHVQAAKPNIPSLQLPPKLLHSSFPLSNCNSPHNRSNSKSTASSLAPSSGDAVMSKSASVKNLWHSFVQSGRRSYREAGGRARFMNRLSADEDPWSPTSTLIGPDAGLSSSSSTSSTLDAVCASPGHIPEVQSTLSRVQGACSLDDEVSCSQSRSLMSASSSSFFCESSAYVGHGLPNLAPSMERRPNIRRKATDRLKGFLKSCRRWRGPSIHRKRNHEEAEMWEPTLATYFHSMGLERTASASGQPLLQKQSSLEKGIHNESSSVPLEALSSSDAAAEREICGACVDGSDDVLKEPVMVFSGMPTPAENATIGLKSKNAKGRRKGGGWVLRKLKKSSKVLAALIRAVAKSTTGTRGSNKNCKRRRLPYQHIDW